MWGLGALVALLIVSGAAAASEDARVADRVVVEKARRILRLYAGDRELASFRVALGRRPVGRKTCQGDLRTPEGLYAVSARKENSDFHRALRLSYPSAEDIERARAAGCDPGGDIMIHGLGDEAARARRVNDWTQGCVAVTNEEIERIWELVPDGTPVEIRP